ncbi:hypothetical protein MNBD_GAMMA15-756 [hydrothermal vent metagenome]|uniref:Type IV fimbrial biogenesis protein PilW n=1 Tax=hydrothermal vent metagenome TaxID=652676 RepID=A0A3B0ZH35_9ZZZZ
MLSTIVSQKGFTLIELMIASLISLIVLSAITTVYSATAQHASAQLSGADLRQQLYTLTELITSDVRRSGYWAFDPLTVSPADNPFELPETRLRIGERDNETAASCLQYSYDLDRDGQWGKRRCRGTGCNATSDEDNVEQFGFRLNRGRVQVRFGGTGTSCNSGSWQSITTPGIVVDTLLFTLHTNCMNLKETETACIAEQPTLVRRAVEFSIEAHISRDEDKTLKLSRWVNLRNAQLLRSQE